MSLRSLASLAAGAGLLLAAPAGAAEARLRVAVLPLRVHSLDDPAPLREGLADMLASRLAREPRIDVVRVADAGRATHDPEAARAAARELRADFVVFGSFTHFGQAASLDLECAATAAPSEPRVLFVEAGALGEVIPKLDPLAEKVVRYVLGGSPGAASNPGASSGVLSPSQTELEDLRRRVEALERALAAARESAPSLAPPGVAAPAPEPAPGVPEAEPAEPSLR